MKELSFEKMELIVGGSLGCAASAVGLEASIWGLAFALTATGVGAPAGVAIAIVGLVASGVGVYASCWYNWYLKFA